MLYTSYFAKVKTFPANSKVYSIANSTPFPMETISCVVPSWNLVSRYKQGLIDENDYIIEYIAMLEQNKIFILNSINNLTDGAILCCYEKSDKFCHRHILADWLRQNNIKIEER